MLRDAHCTRGCAQVIRPSSASSSRSTERMKLPANETTKDARSEKGKECGERCVDGWRETADLGLSLSLEGLVNERGEATRGTRRTRREEVKTPRRTRQRER